MAEVKITGWPALLAAAGLAVFMALRIAAMGDMRGNTALMEKVRMELMSDYMPYEVKKLGDVIKEGSEEAIARQAGALTTAELDISELKASYPVYVFSSGNRTVVIKVRFALKNSGGIVKDGVNYYLCEHHPLGNTWYIKHHSTRYRYLSNFVL